MFNDTPRMAFPTLDPKEEGGTGKHLCWKATVSNVFCHGPTLSDSHHWGQQSAGQRALLDCWTC